VKTDRLSLSTPTRANPWQFRPALALRARLGLAGDNRHEITDRETVPAAALRLAVEAAGPVPAAAGSRRLPVGSTTLDGIHRQIEVV